MCNFSWTFDVIMDCYISLTAVKFFDNLVKAEVNLSCSSELTTCNCIWFWIDVVFNRWFLAGMSIGLQTRYMMEIWLYFKDKKRSFYRSQRMVLVMSTNSIQRSPLHQHRPIVLSWHSGIGWRDMVTASLNGLVRLTNNSCHLLYFPNARYWN